METDINTVTEDWLDTLSCARPKIYSVTTVGIHIHQCDRMGCKMHRSVLKRS